MEKAIKKREESSRIIKILMMLYIPRPPTISHPSM
jgi:hypothetical protein